MGLYNVIPVFIIISISLAIVYILNKFSPIEIKANDFPTLDGLRGYLAITVFVHHSSIWYIFIQTENWTYPASSVFDHFGQSSVTLFFMITSFLFFNKILESDLNPINWRKFLINRFARITPLYLLFCILLFTVVVIYTGFSLNEPLSTVLKSIVQWLTFTISGQPDINKFAGTWIIGAGLTWSLCYEWMFYLFLPIVGLIFTKSKPSITILLLSSSLLGISIYLYKSELIHVLSFSGGIIASLLRKNKAICEVASNKISSVIGIILLIVCYIFIPKAKSIEAIGLLSIVFLIIACGNTFWGLLSNKLSIQFGNISYSIYLLHGIVLFISLYSIIGTENIKNISPINYWIYIGLITIPVIVISYFSRIYIEILGQKSINNLSKKLF